MFLIVSTSIGYQTPFNKRVLQAPKAMKRVQQFLVYQNFQARGQLEQANKECLEDLHHHHKSKQHGDKLLMLNQKM